MAKDGKKRRPARRRAAAAAPPGAHEWVSFEDPDEDRTWVFDVTFLLSRWQCIFGHGLPGGADRAGARAGAGVLLLRGPLHRRRRRRAGQGRGQDPHRRAVAVRPVSGRRGVVKTEADGTQVTRLVDGACIFLNRPGFPAGRAAPCTAPPSSGASTRWTLKPDVCWQLPLRREDTTDEPGRVTSTVTQWDRKHWGEGGFEFHWWCTEAPEAFGAKPPVYRHMRDELTGLVGPLVYGMLAAYLDARRRPDGGGVPVAHPAVRSTSR